MAILISLDCRKKEHPILGMRFACATCPYKRNVVSRLSDRIYPKLKEVDDVLGGSAAWTT
ncbi:DNA-directed RNA polymerase subunit [Caligus rogercresseyi]|uniref:DNA-directed RNA polymerase subunit n=1 Tax=Caligus rogercresseyi TaxID=217165 RepID=A0A7T8JU26_CALRO|nr:DNA-directed RNA polymerase subunit [Caligus rogercresseyi]